METMFFSFGHGQSCPVTGKSLIGHHARVDAPTAELARAAMVQMFGQAWSFPYRSFEALTQHGEFPSVEHVHIEIGGARSSDGEQRCPNCAPGYDCERGTYTRGGA